MPFAYAQGCSCPGFHTFFWSRRSTFPAAPAPGPSREPRPPEVPPTRPLRVLQFGPSLAAPPRGFYRAAPMILGGRGQGGKWKPVGLISGDCVPPIPEGPALWPLAPSGRKPRLISLPILWVIPLQSFFSSLFLFLPVRQVLAFHGERARLTLWAKHWFWMRPGRLSGALRLYRPDQFMHVCGRGELL